MVGRHASGRERGMGRRYGWCRVAVAGCRGLEHVGRGVSGRVDASVARAGVAEVGARHGSGTAPTSRWQVSQSTDEHVAMCDGFEHVRVLPKVAIGGWRWGTWLEISKGTRETMTGAHLGGRGARRRRNYSAIAPPRGVGGRHGHGDGRDHPRPQRSFFSTNF